MNIHSDNCIELGETISPQQCAIMVKAMEGIEFTLALNGGFDIAMYVEEGQAQKAYDLLKEAGFEEES
jgi:hypothetical protein